MASADDDAEKRPPDRVAAAGCMAEQRMLPGADNQLLAHTMEAPAQRIFRIKSFLLVLLTPMVYLVKRVDGPGDLHLCRRRGAGEWPLGKRAPAGWKYCDKFSWAVVFAWLNGS